MDGNNLGLSDEAYKALEKCKMPSEEEVIGHMKSRGTYDSSIPQVNLKNTKQYDESRKIIILRNAIGLYSILDREEKKKPEEQRRRLDRLEDWI